MKYLVKILFFVMLFSSLLILNSCTDKQSMTLNEKKQFVKNAVIYALENRDPHMDYSKYVSPDFINPIDGNTFNYQQWVQHQKDIKKLTKSMTSSFDEMIAEGNTVATIFTIKLVKNDGSEAEIKDMAFFKIKDNKIIYCEELTRLITGNDTDKNIASTK